MAIQGLALEMLAAVSREPNLRTRQPQRWLTNTVELLRESFTEHLTIAQVATAAGVHPVYLAREFRRFHGCTIGEYIRRLRVDRACRQLSSTDESLAAIAASAGFGPKPLLQNFQTAHGHDAGAIPRKLQNALAEIFPIVLPPTRFNPVPKGLDCSILTRFASPN